MKKSRKTKKKVSGLKPARQPRSLAASKADIYISKGGLREFSTTAELKPLDQIIGQQRAMEALEIGLGIGHEGYNIFVAGLTGTGKMETIRRNLKQRLKNSAPPDDWVYVNNFDKPDEPWAIRLRPGQGRQLRRDMKRMIDRFKEELPKAFRQEDFSEEKESLAEKYQGRFQQQLHQLSQQARERGFEMREGPGGNLFFIPLIQGKVPESEEQLEKLSEDERQKIKDKQQELGKEASRLFRNQRDLIGELGEEVRETERRFALAIIQPNIERLKEKYKDNARVQKYLDRVASHVLDNLSDFRQTGQKQMQLGPLGMMMTDEHHPGFMEYQVNVVVDHSSDTGAPVIIEEYPTYKNLFGTIDRQPESGGRWTTDFTQIKSGSILRASGGYLVFNLEDALTEPLVYKNLKRVLRTGHLRFETYDPLALFSTGGIRPEAIPITTKVVVFGTLYVFLLLRFFDEEFPSIFKIKAEFGTEMPRNRNEQNNYAQFVAMLAKEEKLHPFSRNAVIEIIRFGSRRTAQKEKLLTRFSEIADILREANFFATRDKLDVVDTKHIRSALHSRVFRSDRIAEKIRELIQEGTLLIDTKGARAGQVNGLAIVDLGDYAFGRPNRVTASIGLGSEGVLNIEREAKLSGSTHDKGMLILAGYLRNKYGQDKPLALSASICFEQLYGGVDGDSASSTELYALLSRLADIRLRQDIAVTGSINQWGEIQAIGGANEKIEGFFDICREIGLTGKQGVCIPDSNVRNLVLREDVLEAIKKGKFHIYPISSVDQGLELLSGVKAGSPGEKDTFHYVVDTRLREMAQALRDFGAQQPTASVLTARQEIPPQVPPKLPDDNP